MASPPGDLDFHIHTRCSDGLLEPRAVVRLAAEAGLEGISITDHDTLDAYRELGGGADGAGSGSGPWILPGVELSTSLAGGEAHVIGYFPGGFPPEAEAFVEDVLARRRGRILAVLRRLRERGLELTWEDCSAFATGRVVSLTHVAQAIVEKRYAGRLARAYERYLAGGTVPLPDLDARSAVSAVRDLGGIAVWAHPEAERFEAHAPSLRDAGLEGAEVILPRRSRQERKRLAERAESLGLLVTGGSDFHGGEAGAGVGSFRVSPDAVEPFLERIGRLGARG